jgi:hypothetical protein
MYANEMPKNCGDGLAGYPVGPQDISSPEEVAGPPLESLFWHLVHIFCIE